MIHLSLDLISGCWLSAYYRPFATTSVPVQVFYFVPRYHLEIMWNRHAVRYLLPILCSTAGVVPKDISLNCSRSRPALEAAPSPFSCYLAPRALVGPPFDFNQNVSEVQKLLKAHLSHPSSFPWCPVALLTALLLLNREVRGNGLVSLRINLW